MKSLKRLGILCCLLACIVSGRVGADSAFSVFDSNGIYTDTTLTTLLPPGSLVQLIWTADQAYAPYIVGQTDAFGYLVTALDYLLFETNTTIAGGWGGDLDGSVVYSSANVGGNVLPSGYVYLRVFQDGTPGIGELYLNSALVPVVNQQTNVPPDIPDSVDVSLSEPVSMSPVPEPASVSLVGLGLAIIARRYRAKYCLRARERV